MRNLSFALTTYQIRDRTKTVTRRRGPWWKSVLMPGTRLCAVAKSQGLRPGESIERLGVIVVTDVSLERLAVLLDPAYRGSSAVEVGREGFPAMTGTEFVDMFLHHMGGRVDQLVTRIAFEYQPDLVACGACRSDSWRSEKSRHHDGLCGCACHGPLGFPGVDVAMYPNAPGRGRP